MKKTNLYNTNKLFILTGHIGSGKDTFIKECNAEHFSLSMDDIRKVYLAPQINEIGENTTNNTDNTFIFKEYFKILEMRLLAGGLVISNNLNLSSKDIEKHIELGEKYNYEINIIPMDICEPNIAIERNNNRDSYNKVPEKNLMKSIELSKNHIYKEFEKRAKILKKEDAKKILLLNKQDLTIDLNEYENIYHIGDLQGCYSVLQNAKNINFDKDFYIFVGDYIDRGIENDKTIRLLSQLKNKKNVILLRGNHEEHLDRYMSTGKAVSDEFYRNTLPQIHKEFKTQFNEEIEEILNSLNDFFIYKHNEKKVFVNHAGLSGLPEYPLLASRKSYTKGYGGYGLPIDSLFEKHNNDWYQVHGHRNTEFRFTANSDFKSFPLENEVENGGYLPILKLSNKGFELFNIPNNVYKKEVYDTAMAKLISKEKEEDVPKLVNNLKNSELIRVIDIGDNIQSFNFTKNAFFKKDFSDPNTCKARGLFINTKNYDIVARSYDKFFNIKEQGIEGTQIEDIKNNFKGRIQAFKKENGFLGISGYDREKDEIILRGKSGVISPFAEKFQELFNNTLNDNQKEYFKAYLRLNNNTATFEVIDPVFDPHIIKYEKPEIILLDLIKREIDYKREDYEKVIDFADKIGVNTNKNKSLKFKNTEQLIEFYNSIKSMCPIDMQEKYKHEGYVVEDEIGNLIKLKSPYYDFWKSIRSIKDRVARQKIKQENNKQQKVSDIEQLVKSHYLIDSEKAINEGIKFIDKVFNTYSPEEALNKNIIALREELFENKKDLKKNNGIKP